METELTTPVSLTTNRGLLNHGAIGWARRPLVNTDGIASTQGRFGRKAWGRNKRWEYWNVMTPARGVKLRSHNHDAEAGAVWFEVIAEKPANHKALSVVVSCGAPTVGWRSARRNQRLRRLRAQ